jgi:hypothetical protein
MALDGFQSYPAVTNQVSGTEWGLVTRPIGVGTSGSFPLTGTIEGEFFQPVPVFHTLMSTAAVVDMNVSSSTQILAADVNRLYASLVNTHATNPVFVKLGSAPTSASYTFYLDITSMYEVPRGYTGPVFVMASGVTTSSVASTEIKI